MTDGNRGLKVLKTKDDMTGNLSQHDMTLEGRVLRLKVEAAVNGVVLRYAFDCPCDEPDCEREVVVMSQLVCLKWWEKLIRCSMEKKARRTLNMMKKRIRVFQELDEKAKHLAGMLAK